MTRITSTLHEDLWSFMTVFRPVPVAMRNVSGKICSENQNIFFDNHAFYEIMWKNNVQPGRPQMTIWRMRLVCWIPKATNTQSEYVLVTAFPLQQ
jgi:hypothetical protein